MEALTINAQRLIHLDMKGAPPKISYLEKVFPLLHDWGATGLLIEWEDTFPYTDDLRSLGSLSLHNENVGAPYTLQEVQQILELAASNFLLVIPLIQTFGHLEFLLKHDNWRQLREVENYPSSMCPSHPSALPTIHKMIKQIMNHHPQIQYLHIGADEVWHLGVCPACLERKQKFGNDVLFLEHIINVVQFVNEHYPNVKVIMWDDMLRNMDSTLLASYNLGSLVEPMVWHYSARDQFQLGAVIWDKYTKVFPNLWIGSAFKGATGCSQVLPIIQKHVSNHQSWLAELNFVADKINFRGCAFTGWSRYDHYAILCELLPCALPSLALCLKIWLQGGFTTEILENVNKMLGFTFPQLSLDLPIRPSPIPTELTFPGWQIYVGCEWFINIKIKYKNIIDSDQLETWFNSCQIRRNYTNPMQIERFLTLFTDLLFELESLEKYLRLEMDEIYNWSVGDEFINTRIVPIKSYLKQLKDDCQLQISFGVRPHPTLTRSQSQN